MRSAISQNHQFHQTLAKATKLLHTRNYTAALPSLKAAQARALAVCDDPLLGANAQQNYVTATLIIMGVQFRQNYHAETLATYHQLFHRLDAWLTMARDHHAKKRLRGYQALAERACRHLHLERLREEKHHAYNNK